MRQSEERERLDAEALNTVEARALRPEEHEADLLACFMSDGDCARDLAPRLNVADMSSVRHRRVLQAVQRLVERGQEVEMLTVRDVLPPKALEEAGGYGYILDLGTRLPTTAQAPYLFQRVKKAAERRALKRFVHNLHAKVLDLECEQPWDFAMSSLLEIQVEGGDKTVRSFSDVLSDQYKAIEAAAAVRAAGGRSPVVESGWYDFDQTVVLSPKKLIIFAARPAMGKTAISFQLARHIAETRPVLHVTLEMAGEELASRVFAAEAGLTAHQQAHGVVRADSWTAMTDVIQRYSHLPLYIDDAAAATIAQIRIKALRLKAQLGELGAIFIDYLGLVDGKGRDETAKTAAISRASKTLAKELGVPVFVLSQLSREVEKRENKRPQLADLRQSGAIEQDADVVVLLYRDEYYNPRTEKRGVTEVIVAKNRGGPVGTVELSFDAKSTTFSSIEFVPPEPTFEDLPVYDDE